MLGSVDNGAVLGLAVGDNVKVVVAGVAVVAAVADHVVQGPADTIDFLGVGAGSSSRSGGGRRSLRGGGTGRCSGGSRCRHGRCSSAVGKESRDQATGGSNGVLAQAASVLGGALCHVGGRSVGAASASAGVVGCIASALASGIVGSTLSHVGRNTVCASGAAGVVLGNTSAGSRSSSASRCAGGTRGQARCGSSSQGHCLAIDDIASGVCGGADSGEGSGTVGASSMGWVAAIEKSCN